MGTHVVGKSIVVAGAAGGFGKLVAEKTAALGARVTCGDVDGDAAEPRHPRCPRTPGFARSPQAEGAGRR